MEKKHKLISFLGLAKKAGKLSIGKDAAVESILKGSAKLIVFSSDLSDRSSKDIQKVLQENKVPFISTDISMDEFEMVINKKAGIICIKDSGFAKKIQMLCISTEMKGLNL